MSNNHWISDPRIQKRGLGLIHRIGRPQHMDTIEDDSRKRGHSDMRRGNKAWEKGMPKFKGGRKSSL